MARLDLVSDQYGGSTIAARSNGSDDTATIRDAIAHGKRLQDDTYYYKGTGEDVQWINLTGMGSDKTTVILPAGVHLFTPTQIINQVLIEGVNFVGGAGVIKGTWTGTNVTNTHIVRKCRFKDFTGVAIGHCSLDMPYWHVEDNLFWPANSTTSIGVSLSGLTDKSTIRGNKFLDFKCAVKLAPRYRWVSDGKGGQVQEWHNPANIVITENDFIHFDAGTERACVWLVPTPTRTDAHVGVIICDNKFGPEMLDPSDFRVLVCGEVDEQTGDYPAARLWKYAGSTGNVVGARVIRNLFNSPGNQGVPIPILSFTPNTLSWLIADNHIGGATPAAVMDYWYTEPTSYTGSVIGNHTVDYPDVSTVKATAKGVTVTVTDTTGTITTELGQRELPAGWPTTAARTVNPGAAKVTVSNNGDTLAHKRSEGVIVRIGDAADGLSYVSGAGAATQTTWNSNPVIWPATNRDYIGWNPYIIRATVTGSWLHFAGHANNDYRVLVKVDGVPLWDKPRVIDGGTFTGYMAGMLLEFPDAKSRTVEIQTTWLAHSLNTSTGGTITAAPDTARPKVLLFGDSWSEGTDQGGPWLSYSRVVQATTPWDVSIHGQGGTGYTVSLSNPNYKPWPDAARLAVINEWKPDLLVLFGSINDAHSSPSDVGSALNTILDSVKAASPTTKVLIVGPELTDAGNIANLDQLRGIGRARPDQVIAVIDIASSGWMVDGVRGDGSAANPDGNHPTALGVEWLAHKMTQTIRTAGGKAGITNL